MSDSADLPTVQERLGVLAQTPSGEELCVPQQQRQRIFRALADHDDPLLREIGEQLCDGVIRPSQLLVVPGYDAAVDKQLEHIRRLDLQVARAKLLDDLDAALNEAET